MAFSYPLLLSEFMDLPECQVSGGDFYLPDNRGFRTTRAGAVLDYRRAERLWRGSFDIIPLTHAAAAKLEARVSILLEPGASFRVYDKRLVEPANGPIPTDTVSLASVTSSGRDVTFTGLPHALVEGDAFSFSYGSNPVRRAYHRVVARSGSVYQVTPALRAGYDLGAANITFNRAWMKAKIVEDGVTFSRGGPGKHSQGLSVSFVQTLRD